MKNILFILLLFPLAVQSQCRYFDRIFSGFDKSANITYGNAPSITTIYISESFTTAQDLKMDIFQPSGDAETNRGLIIFAHSGGFLTGAKDNQDMQALCDTFAHYGYVTASIEYRKNFNLLSSGSAERAVWRGIQDASAAVRFFKNNRTVYGIDTSKIFFWGSSAGAFMALGLAYIDDAERLSSIFSSPALGCKDCTGNNYAFSSGVAGIISCWGATKDSAWIQNNNNVPAQLFHGTNDGTVPFTEGYPFGLPTTSYVRGSQQLNEQLDRTNIYHEFYPEPGQDHEYWGTSNGTFVPTGPTAYWGDIINKAKVFMAARMGVSPQCGPLPLSLTSFTGRFSNEMVDLFWNTASEINIKKIIVERSGDGMNFERLGEQLPKGNMNSGAAYTATDLYPYSGYSYYRLKMQDADGSFSSSETIRIKTDQKDASITQLYPNPVSEILQLQIQSGKPQVLQQVVFDMTGKKISSENIHLTAGINNTRISFANHSSGMYIIQYLDAAGHIKMSARIFKH
jgi:poly(3-hydroxybutyrate) depolymerase